MPTRHWTADDYRRNAQAEQDPCLLGSQDLMRFVMRLIRREHPPLADDRDLYGPLASVLEFFASMPDRPGRQWTPGDWSAFTDAHRLAVGWLRHQSATSREEQIELLARDFRPAPEPAGA